MVAKVAAWDRHGGVRLVPLQDRAEADLLLPLMDERTRMASWHLVMPDGEVSSAGRGVAPLLRLLPGGAPVARLTSAVQWLTDRAYDFVAAHRSGLGRLLSGRARTRADARLRSRAK
jgi:predicted DCC family thiol-disulfide oxidoreductase YuxK